MFYEIIIWINLLVFPCFRGTNYFWITTLFRIIQVLPPQIECWTFLFVYHELSVNHRNIVAFSAAVCNNEGNPLSKHYEFMLNIISKLPVHDYMCQTLTLYLSLLWNLNHFYYFFWSHICTPRCSHMSWILNTNFAVLFDWCKGIPI